MESLAGRVILLWGWRRALVAFLAGAAAALALPPVDFFAACFIAFPLLVWLLDGAAGDGPPLRRLIAPFAIGWWFGFGYFLAGLWWVGAALLVEAERFAWALPLAVLGLPVLLAVFYGLATALARLLWSEGIGRIAALAFAFGLAEWLRGWVLTGFPWNAIGYTAMPVTVAMQPANLIGLTGMNAVAVFVFAMPALLGTRTHARIGMVVAATLVLGQLGYGYWRLASQQQADDVLNLRIVQPSIHQTAKWDAAERERIFDRLLDLSRRPPADGAAAPELIVWPETAIPFLFEEQPDALARLGAMLEDGQLLATGAVRAEGYGEPGTVRYYNAVVLINAEGEIVDAVDKTHLVPFGEYVPFAGLLNRLGVGKIVQSVGPFTAGSERRPIEAVNDISLLPFICYEIIFPQHTRGAAGTADALLNLTNDAWFGRTPGPYQHFRQARLRAVETGRPLIRAANNGISGVVDARGRIVDAFSLDAVGALDVEVPPADARRRFWRNPSINGLAIVLCFAGVALASSLFRRMRAN